MLCNFEIYQDGVWIKFGEIVAPLKIGDSLMAETISAYNITLYMQGEEVALESLVPGTLCLINFGTRVYSFVVIDGGRISSRKDLNFCYHSYNVQEMLCYAREIYTQNAFFSNGVYDVDAFFTRLFALSESDLELVLSTNEAYETLVENWQRPEYQIASNSLLDNLIKIGQNLQVRFKARINEEGKMEFYAKSLKGDTVLSTINGKKIGETNQYLGANFASKVVANVQNMTAGDLIWMPNEEIWFGFRAMPQAEYALEITADEAVIKLPHKILRATKVRALGMGKIITDSNVPWSGYTGSDYRVFNMDGTRIYPDNGKYVNIDYDEESSNGTYEFAVVSKQEWNLLDPDGSGGKAQHKKNTLYFIQSESDIHNIKICDGEYNQFDLTVKNTAQPICYIEVMQGGLTFPPELKYSKLRWHLNRYIVLANVYYDGLIKMSNQNITKRIAHYGQEENIVSGNSLVENMQNYIESMQNAEETITYEFDDIDDVPEAGGIYNDKIIASINFECTNKKITATMSLSDDHVKKSEYFSADTGLILPTINVDKAFNRQTIYDSFLWFCVSGEEASALIDERGADTSFDMQYANRILESFQNNRSHARLGRSYIFIKMGEHEDEKIFTAIEANCSTSQHMLITNFKTVDNITIGTKVDDTLGKNVDQLRYYPVRFIGESGISKIATLNLLILGGGMIDSYPAIPELAFDNSSPWFSIRDENYYHDPAEIINVTHQMQGKVFGGEGKVYEAFWKENGLFSDFHFYPDDYVREMAFMPDGTSSYIGCGAITEVQTFNLGHTTLLRLGTSLSEEAMNGWATGKIKVWRKHVDTDKIELMIIARATAKVISPGNFLEMYIAFTK